MAETILVVDDEAVNRELLEGILTPAGYRVAEADGGTAALAAVAANPPSIIRGVIRDPAVSSVSR